LDFAPVLSGRKKLGDYKTVSIEITGDTTITKTTVKAAIAKETDLNKAYAIDPKKSVSKQDLKEEDGGKIRVKLSFNEHPTVRSDEKLKIKNSSGKTLKTFNASTLISLSKVGRKYIASTADDSYTSLKPIKLETANDGVIEIVNMDRKSTYNPSYNDNKFRAFH